MMEPFEHAPSPVVELSFEAPGTQRRLTVAFRWILAIPHFLWFLILVIVGFFALMAGWVAALITGRLPIGIAEFLAKILRYGTRVFAYGQYLLTDKYPSFSLEADNYPLELELPPPGRLNRAAVLFRLILMVPGGIVTGLISAGITPVLFVAWLIIVITGRLPRSLFEAFAAGLRYEGRYYAFVGMLTSEQPKKLFGDGPPPEAAARADATPPAFDPSLASPADLTSRWPRITRLTLSKAARRLMVLIIVLGVLFNVFSNVRNWVNQSQTNKARSELESATIESATDYRAWLTDVQSCVGGGGAECLRETNTEFADGLRQFRDRLNEISFPTQAQAPASDLDDLLFTMEEQLRVLAATAGTSRYPTELDTFLQQLEELDGRIGDLDAALFTF